MQTKKKKKKNFKSNNLQNCSQDSTAMFTFKTKRLYQLPTSITLRMGGKMSRVNGKETKWPGMTLLERQSSCGRNCPTFRQWRMAVSMLSSSCGEQDSSFQAATDDSVDSVRAAMNGTV